MSRLGASWPRLVGRVQAGRQPRHPPCGGRDGSNGVGTSFMERESPSRALSGPRKPPRR